MRGRVLYILVILLLAPQIIFADGSPAAAAADSTVSLLVGRSAIVDVGTPIARVSLTSAEVADAMVTSPSQLLINGKEPGTISMFVWERNGALRRYEVNVQRDVAKLADDLRQLFPSEQIHVQSNGPHVVLSGFVSTKDVSEKAASLAGGFVAKKDEVINLLQVAEGGAASQVLLRVRFAEVSRNAMTELASSFFTGANGYNNNGWVGRSTTEQYAAPNFDNSTTGNNGLVFSDFLNFFLFNSKHQIGTVIQALQSRGLFQSLAEPNLVAESGKEASFLAGGEIPVPIAQPSGGAVAITIQWKEFGIRLNFIPTVIGDRIHLKVAPEVSSLDFTNAVTLQGFRIPALTTRKTETELELQDRQTFAIAGLLNNTMTQTLQKMPGIGDIPILGLLFRSKAAQKDQTELVVMITPEILRGPAAVGVTNQMPRLEEPYLAPLTDKKSFPSPPPAFVPPGRLAPPPGTVPPPVGLTYPAPPGAGGDAATAAAAVTALTPSGPQVMSAATAPAPAPAAQASAPTPVAAATPAATRPLTAEEKKALERSRDAEKKQQRADAQAKAAETKHLAKVQAEERQKAAEEKKVADKLAKEQAKKDAAAKKKADEEAKKQAEIDRKQQKQVEEAAARLKAAQAAYDAEVAKKQQDQKQQ